MPSQEDVLFGKIAVKNRLVNETQLKECLSLAEKAGNGQTLGKVLLAKGYISTSQFQAIAGRVKQAGDVKPAGAAASSGSRLREPQGSRPPSGLGIPASEIAAKDYSSLAGQPLDLYLQEARRVGASDLHFQVDAPPFLRLHGRIVYMKHPVLSQEDTKPRILHLLDEYQTEVFTKHNDLDFCYEAEHGRYRANVLRQRKGIDAVFRIIPDHIPTLEELHLPKTLERFTKYRQGIVLITGPAGAGKTATMAALVDMINREQKDHIVTVEDPIEYLIPSKSCNVNQRHVHVHTESFATALRSAMRADPDYICVGEMRDLETMSMAITAAETGHLVFGTLHTTNAVRSIDRMVDVFPPKEQEQIRAMVSESMRGVISQKLLPRADGLGREPALEIMFATAAVANMIREKKTFQLNSVLQTGAREGMITMDDSINRLLQEKLITRETAWFYAESKERFQ
jgi:twitching motility protein PilT